MFGLFKKNKQEETIDLSGGTHDSDIKDKGANLNDFTPSYREMISPQKVEVAEDHLSIEYESNKRMYSRFLYIPRHGYPQQVTQNWLQPILNLGEIDILMHVNTIPPNQSIKMLTKEDIDIRTRKLASQTRGNEEQIREAEREQQKILKYMNDIQEQQNSVYFVSILFNVFNNDSLNDLNRLTEKVMDELENMMARSNILYNRQIQALEHFALLNMKFKFADTLRTMDRDALVASTPMYGGKGRYLGGVPIGYNKIDQSYEHLNIFHPENMNYSVSLIGVAGSGKSLAMKLIINRMTTLGKGMFRIIDVEGEYGSLVKHLGGANIEVDPESSIRINVCSINYIEVDATPMTEEDEEELKELKEHEASGDPNAKRVVEKDNGEVVYQYVPIKDAVGQISDFCNIVKKGEDNIAENALTPKERSALEDAIYAVFDDKGITMNPESLYETIEEEGVLAKTKKVKKDEPTLSDIYEKLIKKQQEDGDEVAIELIHSLKPFLRDGSSPIFDGQTNLGRNMSQNFDDIRTVNFDLSGITNSFFFNIATHVVNNYTWEQFIKSPSLVSEKKLVVVDEFWMHVDHDSTISSYEKMSRRSRKRNAGMIYASQDFQRIADNKKAQGVIANTYTNIFLKQGAVDKREVKRTFQLNAQEMSLLNNPDKGEGIIRVGDQSIWFRTDPSEEEIIFSESNMAKQQEMLKQRGIR